MIERPWIIFQIFQSQLRNLFLISGMFDRILHIEAQFGISFHPAQGKCRGYLSLNAKTDMISSSAGGVIPHG